MQAKVGKRYCHYKNEKEYTVIAIAHHTETDEKLVIYRGHYDTDDLGSEPVFARPQKMWEETLEYKGKIVDRFRAVVDK